MSSAIIDRVCQDIGGKEWLNKDLSRDGSCCHNCRIYDNAQIKG